MRPHVSCGRDRLSEMATDSLRPQVASLSGPAGVAVEPLQQAEQHRLAMVPASWRGHQQSRLTMASAARLGHHLVVKQAEQRGAHWNKTYKADGVAYVMPVKHRAAEAAAEHLRQELQSEKDDDPEPTSGAVEGSGVPSNACVQDR